MPHESRSTQREIRNYLGKISGPLLDRIDIHVEVPQVRLNEIAGTRVGESSQEIRKRVIKAREIQQRRFAGRKIPSNARMGSRELKEFCTISEDTLEMLKLAMHEMKLSARAYDRILKVARTIADLADAERITSDHVGEAVQFRSLDRQIWE